MSIAKKCDRCGALYEPYGAKYEEGNGFCPAFISPEGAVWTDKSVDLCPECMGEFRRLTDIPTAKVFTLEEIIEVIKDCVNDGTRNEKAITNKLYNQRGGTTGVS